MDHGFFFPSRENGHAVWRSNLFRVADLGRTALGSAAPRVGCTRQSITTKPNRSAILSLRVADLTGPFYGSYFSNRRATRLEFPTRRCTVGALAHAQSPLHAMSGRAGLKQVHYF